MRNHMTPSARALYAASVATRPVGNVPNLEHSPTIGQAADAIGVSKALVSQARHVMKHAAPEVVEGVLKGRPASPAPVYGPNGGAA